MNLSFSNRGWPETDWAALLHMASAQGFAGIELYNLHRSPLSLSAAPLHKSSSASSLRALRDAGLHIPCLDSSIDLSSDPAEALAEARELLALARDLGVDKIAVKVMEQRIGVGETLRALEKEARAAGVTVLLKTAGIYTDTALLASALEALASPFFAVLWDVHHPYRERSETPSATISRLGGWVRHVHLRDSAADGSFELIGEGTLPIGEIMDALSSVDYKGSISMVWKPQWLPELADMDILLPHFVSYMSRFESPRGKRRRLYPNHDGSGEYIWKKEELLNLTFSEMLEQVAEVFPDQLAFKYTTLDYTRTYSQFLAESDRFARALYSLGVRSGDKVAIWATNVPAWFITFWATARLGAVLVTMNTAYKIHEAEYLLRQSDTHTLVTIEGSLDSDYKGILSELCPELEHQRAGEALRCRRLPFLRNVITVGYKQKGCLTFEEAMERADSVPPELIKRLSRQVRAEDVVNMQYTSGTTGFPKGVMLTHYNVVNNGKCIGDRLGLSTADRMMLMVPMFHCFGLVLSMTAAMTHGATLSPLPYFSARSALACINQERITCFNGVPTMFIAMFNHADYRKTDFSHMRTGIMAGSGCPPELIRRAADPKEMNMRGIVSVYGQTECAPGNTMSEWTDPLMLRSETVGYAFPHVECKIVSPETGEALPDGVTGEFCARGYNQMKGYYKMPDATRETVDAEGWLHSGDLACRDEEGCYRITGRLKDMIIRGGENLYPKEIEEFIYTHPKVQDVQVIGVPDERYGEEALASVILKEGEELTEKELRDFITASLARHKVPRYIEFTDSFPMNAAGKVLKYKMRQDAAERLGLSQKGKE